MNDIFKNIFDMVLDLITERQFELQQQYTDFKKDNTLNRLQDIKEYMEKNGKALLKGE